MNIKIGFIFNDFFINKEEEEDAFYKYLKALDAPYMVVDWKKHSTKKYKWEKSPVDLIVFIGTIEFLKGFSSHFESDIPTLSYFDKHIHTYSGYQYMFKKEDLFNDYGIILPFSEIKNSTYEYLSSLQGGSELFLRPDNALKVCEASTISNDEDFQEWLLHTQNFTGVSNDSFFWIFKKKEFKQETRFLISNKKVMCGSTYSFESASVPRFDVSIYETVQKIVDRSNIDFQDDIFILDIVEIENESNTPDVKVLEINCLSTSGTYCLNKHVYLSEIVKSAQSYFKEFYCDFD